MSGVFEAGEIVQAEWRGGRIREPNRHRLAVVVEDAGLFDPAYPCVLLVPLTEDRRLGIPDLTVEIEPSAENGCSRPCFALAPQVTATAKRRIRRTPARITLAELAAIRERIAISLGLG